MSLLNYFRGLLGYSNNSDSEQIDIEDNSCITITSTMLHKQHLLRRKSSKRFVIGDEGEEDASPISNTEVTGTANAPSAEWNKSKHFKQTSTLT